MKLAILAIVASTVSSATPILAQTYIPVESEFPEEYKNQYDKKGFYVTVGAGGSWEPTPPYPGGGVAAEGGIGYDFGNNTRWDIAYTYQSFSIDLPSNVDRHSIMSTFYYDIPTDSRVSPYIGVGLGTSILSFNGESGGAFGYQAKLGISYEASETADLFLEGIYSGNTSATTGNVRFSAVNTYGARAGVRFRFGQ